MSKKVPIDSLRKRTRPLKKYREYRRLWRAVEGAVFDAMAQHPEYFLKARRRAALASITKRVVGHVIAIFAAEAKGDGDSAATDTGAPPG